MQILVTGHLGYIGTILTPLLLKEGHEVTGMDSDLFSRCTFGEGMVKVPAHQEGHPRCGSQRPARHRIPFFTWRAFPTIRSGISTPT